MTWRIRRAIWVGIWVVVIAASSLVCGRSLHAQGTGGKGCYFGECGDGPSHEPPAQEPRYEPRERYPQQRSDSVVGQCHVGPQKLHLDIASDLTVYLGPGLIRPVATLVETGVRQCPLEMYDAESNIYFCLRDWRVFVLNLPIGFCWPCPSPLCHYR
jgi:hypothetical protein